MVLLNACASDFPLPNFPKNFTVLKYKSGKITQAYDIKENDALYQSLYNLIIKNVSGWSTDVNTYAPKVYFRSEKMTLICNNDIMVVNYMNIDKKWIQLSKHGTGCGEIITEKVSK